jgi:hypothetical protein
MKFQKRSSPSTCYRIELKGEGGYRPLDMLSFDWFFTTKPQLGNFEVHRRGQEGPMMVKVWAIGEILVSDENTNHLLGIIEEGVGILESLINTKFPFNELTVIIGKFPQKICCKRDFLFVDLALLVNFTLLDPLTAKIELGCEFWIRQHFRVFTELAKAYLGHLLKFELYSDDCVLEG